MSKVKSQKSKVNNKRLLNNVFPTVILNLIQNLYIRRLGGQLKAGMTKCYELFNTLNNKSNVLKSFAFSLLILLLAYCVLRIAPPVSAAKPRVWKTTVKQTVTATKPTFSVKLRADRRALNINFYNINTAGSISYELTYMGNDIEQGVVGTVRQNEGDSAFRLLLFGTCSKNVCTYHRNIQNMQLKITSKLNNGKTLIKKYKIRV